MEKTKISEEYYEQIKPEDIWLFPKISSQKQRRYYDKESLIHPAKMPTFLVQKIIKEYSKPGDLILDPMAGIGTTLVEAILLGRNAIGVEYEKKFVQIIELNLKNVEAFRTRIKGMGKAAILHGDSRQLSKTLKENSGKIDSVITSPPYSDISLKTGVDLKGRIHGRLFGDKRKFTKADYKNVLKHENWDAEKGQRYSKDKANIGNLPHGKADAVITSPPYSNALNPKKNTGSSMKYSEDKEDTIQIGNLEHGKVDAVVTSPPFASSLAGAADDDTLRFKHGSAGKDYSENKSDKRQIGNLKHRDSDDKTNKNQLSNLSGETYLDAMLKVYKECFAVLKQGGLMALVTKNFVRGGETVRLDLDTIKLCEATGFKFKERKYRRLESVSFWIRNARKKFYEKHLEKTTGDPFAEYEDVLVFVKKNAEAKLT